MDEELVLQQFATAMEDVDSDIEELEEEYDQTNEALLALLATLAVAYAWSKENPTPHGKINVIELERQLYKRFDKLSTIESKTYKKTLKRIAQEGYARNFYIVEKITGISVRYKPMSKQRENSMINKPYKGLTLTERAGVNHAKLIRTVKAEIINGMMEGKDVANIANKIQKRIDVNKFEARRLLETEAVRIWTESQMEAWKDSGLVQKVRFVATIDNRTSDECRGRHNKIYVLEEMKKYPPLHPFCRSILVPIFEALNELKEKYSDRKAKPSKTFSAWQKVNK